MVFIFIAASGCQMIVPAMQVHSLASSG